MHMTIERDVAARRFRGFNTTVHSLARVDSNDWSSSFKKRYREALRELCDTYLASITSLRSMMDPETFYIGARLIVILYLQDQSLEFNLAGELIKGEMSERVKQRSKAIVVTICPKEHQWSGTFCMRCFSRSDMFMNKTSSES